MKPTSDNTPLYSSDHYKWYLASTTWYQRLWHRIKYFFVQPRLSKEALENLHYDKIFISQDVGSPDGDTTVVYGQEHGTGVMRLIDFKYKDVPFKMTEYQKKMYEEALKPGRVQMIWHRSAGKATCAREVQLEIERRRVEDELRRKGMALVTEVKESDHAYVFKKDGIEGVMMPSEKEKLCMCSGGFSKRYNLFHRSDCQYYKSV